MKFTFLTKCYLLIAIGIAVSSDVASQVRTYISKPPQHVLQKVDDGINVRELEDELLVKTNFHTKLEIGSMITLKIVSESINESYELILKSITSPNGAKLYSFAHSGAQRAYPLLKVDFEIADKSKATTDFYISVKESSSTLLIGCKAI